MNNHTITAPEERLKEELFKRWEKFKVGGSNTEFRLPFLPSPLELLVLSKICAGCHLHFFRPVEKATESRSDAAGVYISLNFSS